MNNNIQHDSLSANSASITRRRHRGMAALSVFLLATLPALSMAATTYGLTFTSSDKGTITGAASGTSYAAGTQLTLKASPYGSYGVKAWTGDAASCGNSDTCTLIMDGDKTVGLEFKSAPVGFGAGVTGGEGGEVVTVSTPDELKRALCDNVVNNACTDKTPRIIQLASTIDFRGLEGMKTSEGCTYSYNSCEVNGKPERILKFADYCAGRPTYSITHDAAGGSPMLVGSNKTLVGIGKEAGIKGKGLIMGGGVSNIIIRNLSITDINEGIVFAGDAITIDNASRIWIDHNYISRIGRQMIVAGWGTAAGVTISNNFFDGTTEVGHYCDNRHYWVMLLIGENESITLIGNRILNSSGRSPEVGKQAGAAGVGVVHIVNNLFESNFYMGVSNSDDTITFVEGNYWKPSDLYFFPMFQSASNKIFSTVDTTANAARDTCLAGIGRDCVTNFAKNTSDFIINDQVMPLVKQSVEMQKAIGGVTPFPYAKVAEIVGASAGPQENPDD
ncbi:hypothetical protein QUF31_13305 [Dickeya chrysanthemi]|uniref:pectate lyase family protein n=1 Tax=Dickeya chrysanthemi TaxID=556 RepID=UPI0025A17708|nr:hypothetical protein [Dickeya chrysanthemi]WJM84141.1 hypothetical protein QUF31_13305 [Dickeya chrysanthemi]